MFRRPRASLDVGDGGLLHNDELFEAGRTRSKEEDFQRPESELYEEIGRLKMELEWSRKSVPNSVDQRRSLVDPTHEFLCIRRQCELLGVARSSYYHELARETDENLMLMRLMDEQHLKYPEFGRRKMTQWLELQGHYMNVKRVRRLMKKMGLEAVYCRPRTTIRNKNHKVYPYLLRNMEILYPDQVWSIDIIYIPMQRGFMYLVAVIDWYSRHVIAWQVSNTMEGTFCNETLEDALAIGTPKIFNSDQGSQFTSRAFTSILEAQAIQISMDGRGRALDNVFIERLWRTVKYDNIVSIHGFLEVRLRPLAS